MKPLIKYVLSCSRFKQSHSCSESDKTSEVQASYFIVDLGCWEWLRRWRRQKEKSYSWSYIQSGETIFWFRCRLLKLPSFIVFWAKGTGTLWGINHKCIFWDLWYSIAACEWIENHKHWIHERCPPWPRNLQTRLEENIEKRSERRERSSCK